MTSSNSCINLPMLWGIYSEILTKSDSHVCSVMLSGRLPLIAFWQVVGDVSEATIVKDEPVRVDLILYKKGTLSVYPTDNSFGQRILAHCTRNIKKLTVETAPILVRNWLKEFANHDRLGELTIGRQVEKGAFPILTQIAESVKKLSDKTGQIVSKLEEGDFDYLSINMMNFSWPQVCAI
uniref:Autophagy protein 5 n=1 Tax=Panagrellus redivivus TaxID=6233 RepID=A0A7E4V628_PANRE